MSEVSKVVGGTIGGATLPAFAAPYAPQDQLIAPALLAAGSRGEPAEARIDDRARRLIGAIRSNAGGLGGIEDFLHAYSLSTKEGLALMVLAEALLRIPDAHTADELIADKLAGPNWAEKLGRSDSSFVNAATFSLLLTGKVLGGAQDRSDNWKAALGRAVGRLGEPVVRTAVRAPSPSMSNE